MLTEEVDLSAYRARLDATYGEGSEPFQILYDQMVEQGFNMLPFDEAWERSRVLRRTYDAQLEFLIDAFHTPRGFWGHEIGHKLEVRGAVAPGDHWSTN